MKIPLLVLAVLSVVGGWVNLPPWLGNKPAFMDFLQLALPSLKEMHAASFSELASEGVVTLAFILGLLLAWLFFLKKRAWADAISAPWPSRVLHHFWFSDWGMDWFYDRVFVRPVNWFARVDKSDWVDLVYDGLAGLCRVSYRGLRASENGRVRWYAAGVALGTVIFVALVFFL